MKIEINRKLQILSTAALISIAIPFWLNFGSFNQPKETRGILPVDEMGRVGFVKIDTSILTSLMTRDELDILTAWAYNIITKGTSCNSTNGSYGDENRLRGYVSLVKEKCSVQDLEKLLNSRESFIEYNKLTGIFYLNWYDIQGINQARRISHAEIREQTSPSKPTENIFF